MKAVAGTPAKKIGQTAVELGVPHDAVGSGGEALFIGGEDAAVRADDDALFASAVWRDERSVHIGMHVSVRVHPVDGGGSQSLVTDQVCPSLFVRMVARLPPRIMLSGFFGSTEIALLYYSARDWKRERASRRSTAPRPLR